jgi:hypothetical protein
MDKVEYTEQERWLIELKPGTAAARDFGIDLSLTVSNLRLTPEERIKKLDRLKAERRESGATACLMVVIDILPASLSWKQFSNINK